MRNTKYNLIADKYNVKDNKLFNCIIAFISGGFMGFVFEGLIDFFNFFFNLSRNMSISLSFIIIIFLTCLLTALGIFDKLVNSFKAGLLIPITGFAHSICSSALDYKNEGFIYGIGSNFFKLSGSVILYGVFFAFLVSVIRYFIEVII